MSLTALLFSWLTLAFGLFVAARVLPGMSLRGGVGSHLLTAAAFGVFFALLGSLLHFALGVLSFGLLFLLGGLAQVLVGALVLKLTDAMMDRLSVDGFGTAFLASLILTVTDMAVRLLLL